jgi:hypothetical protein
MSQEAVVAPKVHLINPEGQYTSFVDGVKKESISSNYLFENIDTSILNGDEEVIRNSYM